GPATLVIAVEEARNVATRADAEVVVHEIATEGAAVPSQSVGVLWGLRVEQQPRAPQCRGAQEDDARKDLVDVAGGGVDEPNAGNPVLALVEDQRVREAVRPQRHPPRRPGGGQGRRLAGEVASGRAATGALAA